MKTLNDSVFGFWKITSIRFLNSDEKWEDETLFGGSTIITKTGNLTTYTKTSDLSFGYSGTFKVKGDDLLITPDVCTIPEMEGNITIRTVKSVSEKSLLLGSIDEATGRTYEFEFELVTRGF